MKSAYDITLSHDLSEDELAQHWILSSEDILEVNRSRKPIPRIHWAVQLCVLRLHGRFLTPFIVPSKITNYLHKQIGLPLTFIDITDEPNIKTKFEHFSQISTYCRFSQFKSSHSDILMNYLNQLVNEGIEAEQYFELCLDFLFKNKILPPGESIIQ